MPNAAAENAAWAIGMARTRFLHGLNVVPDDRLNWSPGGSAGSALVLAGKLAGFLGFLKPFITRQPPPDMAGGPPPPPATREEARTRVEAAFKGLESAVAGLTDADFAQTQKAPWGAEYTIGQWVAMLPSVMGYFQGQLNYLQLAYGDEDPNMPPEWTHGQ